MHLGLIGYGNIATTLLGLLTALPEVSRLTVLVRPSRLAEVAAELGARASIVDSAAALVAAAPDMVVECAGHSGVVAHVPTVLKAGIDVVLVSIGALADAAIEQDLHMAAQEGGARLILPAGAVGGVDLLSALNAAGDLHVTYKGTKPPRAWAGTPAENTLNLSEVTHAVTFFNGTAREAARDFPKNANVAATLALAGAGFEATQVELIADPAAPGNIHAYEVQSPIARYSIKIENLPSTGNAKTSVSTAYSVLREIRNRIGPVAI